MGREKAHVKFLVKLLYDAVLVDSTSDETATGPVVQRTFQRSCAIVNFPKKSNFRTMLPRPPAILQVPFDQTNIVRFHSEFHRSKTIVRRDCRLRITRLPAWADLTNRLQFRFAEYEGLQAFDAGGAGGGEGLHCLLCCGFCFLTLLFPGGIDGRNGLLYVELLSQKRYTFPDYLSTIIAGLFQFARAYETLFQRYENVILFDIFELMILH